MTPVIYREYGVSTTLLFDLLEVDGVDLRTDAVHASGDTVIMKDEGAEANTTNGFTDEGSTYSIVLSATEMQAARIKVIVIDQTATKVWLDVTINIETYGHASAQHETFPGDVTHWEGNAVATPTNNGVPEVDVLFTGGLARTAAFFDNWAAFYSGGGYAGGTIKMDVNAVQVSGDSTAADNLEADYDGSGYAKPNSTIGTVTTNTDMRGTDNAALASVLGALADAAATGDPTATDTVMQYLKQVVNVLAGNAGIATFPAEAAPANNVNLAEVLRAIHADVTGLNGDAMRGTDGANTTTPLTAAQVNTEVDTALADVHLDHLLAVDYDPASKPGVGTALLNELVEDDSGVSRFTANALEQAPSGGGGSDLFEIKGEFGRTGSTYDYVFWLEQNGQIITSGLSAADVDAFGNGGDTDLTVSTTPTISATGRIYGSLTLGTAITDNVPTVFEAQVTYSSTVYKGELSSVAVT